MKKSLPPWLQNAKAEGAKEAKSGKAPSKAHEKGESARFEKAEDAAMKKPKAVVVKKFAGGGGFKPSLAGAAGMPLGAPPSPGRVLNRFGIGGSNNSRGATAGAPARGAGQALARRAYADGGKVDPPKAPPPDKKDAPKPTLAGGLADSMKRRTDAMDAMERGEAPVKKADGGKINKGLPNKASMPKQEARSDPKLAGNAGGNVVRMMKNGGKVKKARVA